MTDYIVPLILLSISLLALRRKENAYDTLLQGASEGLVLIKNSLPALILLLTAVGRFWNHEYLAACGWILPAVFLLWCTNKLSRQVA